MRSVWFKAALAAGILVLALAAGAAHAQAPFTIPPGQYFALSYHDVRDDVVPERDRDPYAVNTQRLAEWFDWMRDHGWQPVSFQQIVDAHKGRAALPENAVLLTFDDGLKSVYTHIYPLLKAYSYPALVALQTGWLETLWATRSDTAPGPDRLAVDLAPSASAEMTYNDAPLTVDDLLSLDEIREMQASGLIEFASHSHDLHRGIRANPQGNEQPAAITRHFDPVRQTYEDAAAFRARVTHDLQTSRDALERMTGVAPRVIVWPYGASTEEVEAFAAEVGMPWSVVLGADPINDPAHQRVYRLLVSGDPTPVELARRVRPASAIRTHAPRPQRVVHIDLDYVYDPDPEQTNRNLGALIERIRQLQIRTVYLQAFADPDGDGNANALYFPNRHLPMRADLFNRVSWQLRTRAGVEVYAWMPLLAFDLPDAALRTALSVTHPGPDGRPVPAQRDYRRLSPFLPRSIAIVGEIYADLGIAASGIDGILIHDDAYLAEDEDLTACRPDARWPGTDRPLADCALTPQDKTRALIDFGDAVIAQARRHINTAVDFKTARNLYARVVLEPEAEARFAQSLPAFVAAYDEVALMAMPWLDGTELEPEVWLMQLADAVEAQVGHFNNVVFELQARDWRGEGRWIDGETLRDWMRLLVRRGVLHYGYYPDDFLNDQPRLDAVFEGLSLNAFPHRR